ncbi:hypothetical protein M8J76_001638 [Diaphorina citri]|nr:hypothetical protein M8J76_001638 [Diaphorina citri]
MNFLLLKLFHGYRWIVLRFVKVYSTSSARVMLSMKLLGVLVLAGICFALSQDTPISQGIPVSQDTLTSQEIPVSQDTLTSQDIPVSQQDSSTIKSSEDLTVENPDGPFRSDAFKPYWTWECKYNKCVKSKISTSNEHAPQSLGVCKLRCGEYRTLWPRPTGEIIIGDTLIPVNPMGVEIVATPNTARSLENGFDIVKEMEKNFKAKMVKLFGNKFIIERREDTTKTLYISLNIAVNSLASEFNGDEAYEIRTQDSPNHVNATITANTFFGGHHGAETLSQLIVYDPYTASVVMPERVEIQDSPVYPYRGILLDTARNFYTLDNIKKTIDGMAVNKLNYFHWHITDSQSFPFESRKYPTLTQSGAYSSEKIYSREDIREIVHYGLVRGVHVIPELDAPAHVGEGWNSIEKQKDELLVCFKKEPWTKFCVEPPCGQLNPVSDRVYEVLGGLYEEMTDLFRTDLSGLFHMGGDEKRALAKLSGVKNKPKRVIIWTSTLTEGDRLTKYLDSNKYIIQIWTTGSDPQVANLLRNKFPVIFSNYEALYFDCGFGAWVGEGNNWCSPYIGWQKVYDNDPIKLLDQTSLNISNNPELKSLIMGQEAALWSEQADAATLDGRLWPRASAMAERLWSNPASNWRAAEYRFLHQRERLVEIGLAAESIEPEWCYQNEGLCNGDRSG